jgi:hypothetical protein
MPSSPDLSRGVESAIRKSQSDIYFIRRVIGRRVRLICQRLGSNSGPGPSQTRLLFISSLMIHYELPTLILAQLHDEALLGLELMRNSETNSFKR